MIKLCCFIIASFLSIQFTQEPSTLCDKAVAIENLNFVNQNAKSLLALTAKINDNCIIEYLDTLTECFIATENLEYLHTLDVICGVADGFVGEYYWEVTEKIINEKFSLYMEYLYSNDTCLEKQLLTISTAPNVNEKINSLMDKELKRSSGNKKEYLINLSDRINNHRK